ncbi:hypothetical protein JI667_10975 [Bacillus sp. NTK074B]|nr:hypothetical protein [Bacillus sp. NTK074B]
MIWALLIAGAIIGGLDEADIQEWIRYVSTKTYSKSLWWNEERLKGYDL